MILIENPENARPRKKQTNAGEQSLEPAQRPEEETPDGSPDRERMQSLSGDSPEAAALQKHRSHPKAKGGPHV